jgi:hypothetical protein
MASEGRMQIGIVAQPLVAGGVPPQQHPLINEVRDFDEWYDL